jgi:F-type H+-transporting ATPase subunit delta
MASPIVHNFSKALVDLAVEKGNVAAIHDAADSLLPRISLPEVRTFLNHPSVKNGDKKEFFTRIIPEDAPQELINLIHLIVDRRYTALLPEILNEIADLTIRAQGYEIITVITAVPFSETEAEQIRVDLEAKWATRIFLKIRVNPNLIGGMIIQRDDRMYDGSLLGKINGLRRILTEQSVS